MSRERKRLPQGQNATRELMGVREISPHSLVTEHGEIAYFIIQPTNIAVLSDTTVGHHVYALMNVLKGLAQIEFLCLNGRESYESNKRFLHDRMKAEDIPQLCRLLSQDATHLDQIQVQMATAREFIIAVRLDGCKGAAESFLTGISQTLKDQGFRARLADHGDIRRILAVYFEQDVTTERFDDFDGQRWIMLE